MVSRVIAGRYHLLQKIGEGTAAEVFEAMDTRLERVVALKLLRLSYGYSPTVISRFEHEAKMAAKLAHPNIVDIFDYDRAHDRYYITMEYVRGQSLEDLLRKRAPLSEDECRRVGIEILKGLGAAHAAGLVHRDMKPQNVLLSRDGQIKITDFGIARAVSAVNMTQTGTVFGTPRYMAPEQARAEPATPRSDLYSVGVMLYEMLAGRPLFEADSPVMMAYAHVFAPPPPLRDAAPGASPAIAALIERALVKDPDKRFRDVGEMLRALEESSGGDVPVDNVTAAYPGNNRLNQTLPFAPSPFSRSADIQPGVKVPNTASSWRPLPRKWLLAMMVLSTIALSAVLLLQAIELGGDLPSFGSANRQAASVATHPPVATLEASIGPTATGPPTSPALIPTPSSPSAFTSPRPASTPVPSTDRAPKPLPGLDSKGTMFKADAQRTGMFRARGVPGRPVVVHRFGTGGAVDRAPAVFDSVAYFGSRDRQFYAVDVATGRLKWRAPFRTDGEVASAPTIAGDTVYFGSDDGALYALNSDKGSLRWKFPTGGAITGSPVVSDGVVYFGSTDHHLYAVDATLGTELWRFHAGGAVHSAPAVSRGIIYFGSYNGRLYAVNTRGEQTWNFATGGAVVGSPAVAAGFVYVGSFDRNVYKLRTSNGQELWRVRTDSPVFSSPAAADGTVYVGAGTGLLAIDARTGKHRKVLSTGGRIFASAAVASGIVYIGSLDGWVYAWDSQRRRERWRYVTAGEVYSSVVADGNRIYVGTADGYLLVLKS